MSFCKNAEDEAGQGRACEALARCHRDRGDLPAAVTYLTRLVDISERTGQDKLLFMACTDLGGVYSTLQQFHNAVDYCGRAFRLACAMGDRAQVDAARVRFAMARASDMTAEYGRCGP